MDEILRARLNKHVSDRVKYYILDGDRIKAVPFGDWAIWFETADRKIARTEIGDVLVSTVFLGLDHSFLPDSPPILFETMIFGGEHDGYQDRYRTIEEAKAGHERAVRIAKGYISPDETEH